MALIKDRWSKMMYDGESRSSYESNYWNQYHALARVKCTVKDERLRIELYQHFIHKLFRVNDVVRLSGSMRAEVADYLSEEFMVDHRFGGWMNIPTEYRVVEDGVWFPPVETVLNRRIGERLVRLYHQHGPEVSHILVRCPDRGSHDVLIEYKAGEPVEEA